MYCVVTDVSWLSNGSGSRWGREAKECSDSEGGVPGCRGRCRCGWGWQGVVAKHPVQTFFFFIVYLIKVTNDLRVNRDLSKLDYQVNFNLAF